jgi:mono/diheme cytochrome c family protein
MKNTAVFALPVLLLAGHLLTAQQIKKVPPAPTLPGDGKAMFVSYCAACHGANGKGNGPAAPALTRKPADLTVLASRNSGVFPTANVYRFINGDDEVAAHGTREMPIWGSMFSGMNPSNDTLVKVRIEVLIDYLKSLQNK